MYPINPFNPYQGVNPSYLPSNGLHGNNNQIVKVNGRNGAEAYQMPPNSQVLLLDETQPVLWLKQTDGAGYPSLNAYDITPHEDKPIPDVKSLEDRIAKIEQVINNEPYHTNNGKQNAGHGTSKANGTNDKTLQ